MTVKELKEILNGIENEEMVVSNGYYCEDINGYYFVASGESQKLVLSSLNVQPRKTSDK